jgi:hypothetical protein
MTQFLIEDIIAVINKWPSAPPPVEPGVYLYAATDFRGPVLRITESVSDLAQRGFDNRVSSWLVVGDYSATGFVGKNFTGDRATLWSGTSSDNVGKRWIGFGTPGFVIVKKGLISNSMSSVGIGTAAVNKFDNPLYWPRGAWISSAGTAGGTLSWRFAADHTYRFNIISGNSAATRIGHWGQSGDQYGFRKLLHTYNNSVTTNSGQGPYPNESYPYRLSSDGRALDVLVSGIWTRYEFKPE